MDPSTRNLLLDAGFILGTLVVALASYFIIRAASDSGAEPRTDIAGIVATSTANAAASPTGTATALAAAVVTLAPTSTPSSSPTPTPTPEATPLPEGTKRPLDIVAALGRNEPYVCEGGVSTNQDDSLRRAIISWNQITEIWNRVVESETQLNTTIPSPFTLENAAASDAFLNEARRHQDVVLTAIDALIALRQQGIHTQTREMSLQQGNFYDIERLTVQSTIAAIENFDAATWNEGVFLEEQRNLYLDSARAEMIAVCGFIKQP